MSEAAPRRPGNIRAFGLALAACALLLSHCALAQPEAAPPPSADSATPAAGQLLPTFDVVSIKLYGPNNLRISIATKPDGVAVSGMPMHMILREAFGVTNDRLLGEPAWAGTSRYDLDAKVAPDEAPRFKQLTNTQQWQMLLPVLEERCALQYHHETRELTVYSLVAARGGPKLQASMPAKTNTGQAPGPSRASAGASVSEAMFTISGHGQSTATIARWVSLTLGSTVLDKTGLTGAYDYTLSFVPDDSMKAGILPPGSGGGAPPAETDGPSIFAALQEQLGLKLVAQKQPVDVIVIDHMEPPTAN